MAKQGRTKPLSVVLANYEPIPECGCWIWMGAYEEGHYGQITYNKKHWSAHRLSWTFHRGRIPKGMNVLHHCDIRLCINPSHLFLGTKKDNTQDAKKKNRLRNKSFPGEHNPRAKLTDKLALLIRSSSLDALTIAKQLNVSRTTVYGIRKGERWRHLKD